MVFFVFLGFFGIFWDDIPTLNLNTKKTQKIPKKKKPKKKPKKTNGAQKTSFQFRMLAKAYAKKTKKAKKNQKKKTSFQFRILAKTNAKKQKKKPMPIWKFKKTKKNQKKTIKNQCQFTDFGVATGFFLVFLGEHPLKDNAFLSISPF